MSGYDGKELTTRPLIEVNMRAKHNTLYRIKNYSVFNSYLNTL